MYLTYIWSRLGSVSTDARHVLDTHSLGYCTVPVLYLDSIQILRTYRVLGINGLSANLTSHMGNTSPQKSRRAYNEDVNSFTRKLLMFSIDTTDLNQLR